MSKLIISKINDHEIKVNLLQFHQKWNNLMKIYKINK